MVIKGRRAVIRISKFQAVFIVLAIIVGVLTVSLRLGTKGNLSEAQPNEQRSATNALTGGISYDEGRLSGNPKRTLWMWPAKVEVFFNPGRLETDLNYRRFVEQYWVRRNLKESASREPMLTRITGLFISNGIPTELVNDLARMAYSDLSSIQRFEKFGRDALPQADEHVQAILTDAGKSDEVKAVEIETTRRLAEVVSSKWRDRARRLTELSTAKLKRESGIQNPDFYRNLYEIRLSEDGFASGISTNMADNESLFGPQVF